jgi:hypothetical protein
MPVIIYEFDASSITADMLPIEVEVGPIGPFGFGGTPEIPVEIGSGAFDFGMKVIYSCPGWPLCGKPDEPCQWEKSKVWQFDPLELVSLKIPGIPAFPKQLGPYGAAWSIPSKSFQPFECPNYPLPREGTS